MKIFIVTLFIFSFLILSDSVCPPGGYNNAQHQFGPGCMYRCHCVGDVQCDYVTGECPGGCAAAWMGPGCQYGDIAYNKLVRLLSSGSNIFIDGRNATDGLPTTCVGPATLVGVDLNATYRISEILINLSKAVSLQGLEVTVGNASFDLPSDFARTCFKQNITEHMGITSNVVCTTDIIGRYLLIRIPDNSTKMIFCDVRVYGGRSLAYRRDVTQSSTLNTDCCGQGIASRALDGSHNTNFRSGTCTHTNVENSAWWRVNLAKAYNVERIVLYGRLDCCAERLSGFSVSYAANSTFSLVFKYPEETPMEITEVTTLFEDLAQRVEISLKNKIEALTLCEVFVFGDCQNNVCGWECDTYCYCEGLTDKQNKIYASCPSGCKIGWWGYSCNNSCDTNCKDKKCSQSDGHCFECCLGKWGHFCENDCINCQNGTGCDNSNGICTLGCLTGWWGYPCNNTCVTNCKDNTCNQSDGHCFECFLGKWGHFCENDCINCQNGTGCDNSNGICTLGCLTGWWGYFCNNTCATNCKDNTCNQSDGQCLECFLGKWGQICENNCTNCLTGTGCGNSNGICTVGCLTGLYGVNCSEHCGHCAGDGSCNRSTGDCGHGCQPGWQEDNCTIACSEGWYGLNCSNICGHCANKMCDPINGTCPSGCSEGYNGTMCFERLQEEKISTESSSALPIGVPVGVALGAAGLTIIIILVAIILWKRRNGALGGKRYQSEEPDRKTSNVKFSSDIYENASTLKLEEERSDLQPAYENSFFHLNSDRKRDTPVKQTEESDKKIGIHIYRNAAAVVEVMGESDTDETLENSDENVHQNVYYNTERSSKRGGKKITVQDLSDYVKRGVHLSNNIEEEFKKLLSGPQHEMNIALKPKNRQKNRYKGMYAYDENRVILDPLSDEPDTDYINASFINGYKRDNAYIAAQGTITATVNDFWRMIWQYDIQQIVMLTGLIEQGKQKCLQYWPNEGTNEYGMIRVELTDEEVCAEYAIRSFLLSKTGSKKQKNIKQFHFTSWPDRGVPDTASSLVQFWKKVRHSGNALDSPILVHCSAGIGRTGTYIALDYIFDEGSEEGYVNIFDCINKLREQRVGLVQTTEQYIYLHEAVLEAFKDTGTYVSVDDFQNYYAQMRCIDPGTKRTKILTEFQKLQEDEHDYFKRIGMGVTTDRSSDSKDEFLDGKSPENKTKNRYNNILPSERYRPYLSTYVPGRNDYINAVCLPTRKNRKGLLVTQMPLPDTVIDFWRLVYDSEVQSIVMLNEANIPGEEVGIYWPEKGETSRYGPFVVKLTSNVEKSNHIERMLQVSKHGEAQTLSVKQYVCSVWRLHDSVPKSIDGFLNLIEDVGDWKRHSGEQPILVHCLNGAERSGLFCVLWCALEKLKSDREVAIRSIVRQMRIRRQQILPNFEQYKFCHDVILFHLNNSTTYTNM